jgi:hypothetical protein
LRPSLTFAGEKGFCTQSSSKLDCKLLLATNGLAY